MTEPTHPQSLDRALRERPTNSLGLNELGIACHQAGRLSDAIGCFEEAVSLTPGHAAAHNNLGNTYKIQGKHAEAIAAYRAAIRFQPANADFEMNLGRVFEDAGNSTEAVRHFRNAAELEPRRADCHAALATLYLACGKNVEAYQAALRVIKIPGADLGLRVNMANLFQEIGRHAEAEYEYRRVLEIDPLFFGAHSNLAYLLSDQSRVDEARQHYAAAISIDPSPRLQVVSATKIPAILASADQIQTCRQQLAEQLDELYAAGVHVDPRQEIMPTLFYLAYHGQNDRDLLEKLTRLGEVDESQTIRLSPLKGRRIRIGFLSMNLKQHTIGGLWVGLIERLSREDFEVTILAAGPGEDSITKRIRVRADHYVQLPQNPPVAIKLARDQQLDVILFPDIGMDPFTYTLAYSRLAPIQCVTWGHPTTTGLRSIDYFLSSEHLETEDSPALYTEQLARFRRLMVYYERPTLDGDNTVSRGQFGIPEKAHVYGCPQSLFKFHPDFDPVIRDILASDENAILVMLDGRYPAWKQILIKRFRETLGTLCDRIHFVPRVSRPRYLNLLSLCDVLLDPLHFGGGNTSYEGFSMGVPVVTLPSHLLRARLTYAMYQQMGINEFVAQDTADYVRLAVSLGTNVDYRTSARRKIAEAANCIFNDRSAISEFEEFIRAILKAEERSPGTRINWRPLAIQA